MTVLLDLLAHWPGARWLQGSGTAYLFVNAAHILGLGLLIGAIVPMDWQLMRGRPLPAQARLLSRSAAWGLALAVLMGLWLFTVKPQDYAANTAFLWKIGLLALALLNALWQHSSAGWASVLAGHAPSPGVRCRAALSALLWLAVLVAGRWIGFL